tara:strand:+ start:735 stop:854 length:120 start_codon:yes stop_codon:yes gene_type:complete
LSPLAAGFFAFATFLAGFFAIFLATFLAAGLAIVSECTG